MIKDCKKESSCFITGHRPEKLIFKNDESDSRCIKLKKSLRKALIMAIQAGKNIFYTGMANGSDLWAGEIIKDLKKIYPNISLICVIPFKGQENTWNTDTQIRYHKLIEQSDLTITLSFIMDKKYYLMRNQLMVFLSSMGIAVYDEKYKRSGTGMTVNLAKKQGLEIIKIDTNSFDIKDGDM